jgi:NADH dehydrogenase [ubiquinone] 1 alpha subcomplex assembly factor 7
MSPAPADEDGEALLEALREAIRRDGPMPVDRYMQLCLGDPEHGYWRRGGSIGAAGDFITAPEISQVFGELIGLWCAVVWQGMGRPDPLRLVELGPGRGTLMRDGLRAAERMPGFLDAASIHLVEVSGPLHAIQRQTLASSPRKRASMEADGVSSTQIGHDVTWHDTLADVPEGPAIVVGNEFLDALPIRQLVFDAGNWRERVVTLDAQGALQFGIGNRADGVDDEAGPPPESGAVLELRPGEDELLALLTRRQAVLTALFIDYGPAGPAYGDTLQAVHRHVSVDALSAPGRADLTAHVRFAALARRARKTGLPADGPIAQAEFLGALGIAERTARLMAANPGRAGEIETATQRLVSPTGMGSLFKVLALRSPHLPPPPPFV